MPFLVFRRDHLRSTSGIIFGSGSFAVQFGDHFRSGWGSFAVGDHLRRCTNLSPMVRVRERRVRLKLFWYHVVGAQKRITLDR